MHHARTLSLRAESRAVARRPRGAEDAATAYTALVNNRLDGRFAPPGDESRVG